MSELCLILYAVFTLAVCTALIMLNFCHKAWPVRGVSNSTCNPLQVDLPSWVNFPDYERVGWVNSIIGV